MKNQELINQIEKVKGVLTQAQKDLEDGNLQGAGDCAAASQLMLKPIVTQISNLFNDEYNSKK